MGCPICSNHISFKPYFEVGMEISCPQCGARLIISSVEPMEFEAKND